MVVMVILGAAFFAFMAGTLSADIRHNMEYGHGKHRT